MKKKIKIYLTKTSTAIIVLENNSQIIQINVEINHLLTQTTEDDQQIKNFYVISRKTSIVH